MTTTSLSNIHRLVALLVVTAAAVSASPSHKHRHVAHPVSAAACAGPALAALPTLPLPSYYVPASVSSNFTAGGRFSRHGWLMLPWDRSADAPAAQPINAWFYHHTPEFFLDSPHDFLLMLSGQLILANTSVTPLLPLPPAAETLGTEFVWTPPAFSLNDLIVTPSLAPGLLQNGSFDTPQRFDLSDGKIDLLPDRTVHYLSSTAACSYANPVYLSYPRAYPRGAALESPLHLYFVHLVWASPDFDQVLHVTLDPASCASEVSAETLNGVGVTFSFPTLGADVLSRPMPAEDVQSVLVYLPSQPAVQCAVVVVEQVHCVIMPDSFANCPPVTRTRKQKKTMV